MPITPSHLSLEDISARSRNVDMTLGSPIFGWPTSGLIVTFSPEHGEPVLVSEPARRRHELFLPDTIGGAEANMCFLQALGHVDLHSEGMVPTSQNKKVRISIGQESNTEGPDGVLIAREARQYAISALMRDVTEERALEIAEEHGIAEDEIPTTFFSTPSI